MNQLIEYLYLTGLVFSFLFLLRGLISILILFRKAKSIKMDCCRLLVVDREVPAFSFGRLVVLSQHDYEEHRETLLAHEQAHIRLNHFFDLLLLEAVKILHWFNPVIYWMAKDLKEIHEFQADDYTLTKGIDVTQYQLLIIQKGVGSQKFALANSFNHCQIKKRIVMMNKSKTNKAGSWKVATFLPLLALLLMAFGRKAEYGPPSNSKLSSVEQVLSKDSIRQWSEADFLSLDGLNLLIKMGKSPNWKDPEFASFEKNGKWVTVKKDYFNGFDHCKVQIDSRSQLRIGNRTKLLDWNEFRDSIRTYVDYEVANNLSRPYFHPAIINGVIKMSPQCYFFIISDKNTPIEDYQRILNTIGNAVYEIRGKYSLEIYKKEYSKLNSEQREQIDIMVPLMARFLKTPQLREEKKIAKDSISAGSKQENFPLNDRIAPCDAKLTDRTIANTGKDATYIQGMMATEKGDRLEGSSFSMTLNEGVLYRFTTGSSELSQVDVIVNLYFGFDKKLIKQQKVEPGKYGNFEFSCENTGKYAIRLSYKEKGKSCVQILLSKVSRE